MKSHSCWRKREKREKRRNPCHYFRSERLHFPERKKKKEASIEYISTQQQQQQRKKKQYRSVKYYSCSTLRPPVILPRFFFSLTPYASLLRAHLMAPNPVPSPLHHPHPFPLTYSPTSLPSPYRTAHSPLPTHQAYPSSHYS